MAERGKKVEKWRGKNNIFKSKIDESFQIFMVQSSWELVEMEKNNNS